MSEANTSRWARWRGRLKGMIPFASGVTAALLALVLYNFLFPNTQLSRRDVNEAIAIALASATPRPAFSAQVYEMIAPSLVLIETVDVDAVEGAGVGVGSGVIVNQSGEILTSLHVVANAAAITVIFADGTESPAKITLQQPEIDIAVLQPEILPAQFLPATLGNPGAMRVGDEVFVVGHPFGLTWSLSAGVISGFDRAFTAPNNEVVLDGLIQFDAAANPGNSGGPLLNRNGHVIAIVSGVLNPTDDGVFIGIGFAVPIGTATGGMGSPPY